MTFLSLSTEVANMISDNTYIEGGCATVVGVVEPGRIAEQECTDWEVDDLQHIESVVGLAYMTEEFAGHSYTAERVLGYKTRRRVGNCKTRAAGLEH